jgi:hypothetical protein
VGVFVADQVQQIVKHRAMTQPFLKQFINSAHHYYSPFDPGWFGRAVSIPGWVLGILIDFKTFAGNGFYH